MLCAESEFVENVICLDVITPEKYIISNSDTSDEFMSL